MPAKVCHHLPTREPAKSFPSRSRSERFGCSSTPGQTLLRHEANLSLALTFLSAFALRVAAQGQPTPEDRASRNDQGLAAYFRTQTDELAGRCLTDIHSLGDWEARRGEYRRQLQEMLGLWPVPERADLKPVITGKLEQPDFTVEKLHFQALPCLYVTANLYLPKNLEQPAPAILYVCGHSQVVTNGISCGNKAGYQRHGEWFARNGYVCLVIDTLQLGEIQGQHHGTYTRRAVVVEQPRLHPRRRRGVVRHPRPGLPVLAPGGGQGAHRHDGPLGRRLLHLDRRGAG